MNALYVLLTRWAAPDEKAKFDFALNQPPPGVTPDEVPESVLQADADAWMAAAANLGALRNPGSADSPVPNGADSTESADGADGAAAGFPATRL